MSAEEEQVAKESWGKTPAWILDPDLYLPAYYAAVPEDQRKPADEKPLNASELRVYVAMRTFADRNGKCKARAQTIADRAKIDKSSAERAISKFRRLGWLTSQRHYRDDGSISRCDYFMRDACPTPEDIPHPQDDGGVPVKSRVGYPRNHGEGTRESTGAKNTPEEHTRGTQERSGVECPPSGRFAPSGPDDDANDQPLILNLDSRRTTRWTNWRQEDLNLLAELVGSDKVRSDGTISAAGVYSIQHLYNSLTTFPGDPKEWPGRWMKTVAETTGVDNWLARYGLEPE